MFIQFQLRSTQDCTDNVCDDLFLCCGEVGDYNSAGKVKGQGNLSCSISNECLQGFDPLCIPVVLCLPQLMPHVSCC